MPDRAVAELRPLPRRRRLTAEELVERHRKLPPVDYMHMRQESDELPGEDRVGDDDPCRGSVADRYQSGVQDTCTYIDLDKLDPASLPVIPEIVALTLEVKRDFKPRRIDLMIAAIASAHDLPLFTRNVDDFAGLDDMVTVVAV